MHPWGRAAWTHERAPLNMTPEALYEAVRNVAIAALVARHWPGSGVRHGMVGHLTGMLLHGNIDLMVPHIIKAAAIIAQDSDPADREKFARNTVAKFQAGENVTGRPTCGSLGDGVVEASVMAARGRGDVRLCRTEQAMVHR